MQQELAGGRGERESERKIDPKSSATMRKLTTSHLDL